jgi:hypothetical protein
MIRKQITSNINTKDLVANFKIASSNFLIRNPCASNCCCWDYFNLDVFAIVSDEQ